MSGHRHDLTGLTTEKALQNQAEFGKNELAPVKKSNILIKFFKSVCEPMFLLLLSAAAIYFILGEYSDGAIMLVFVLGMIVIEFVQETRADKTLARLRDLSAPHITVIRDGAEVKILSADLVPGDLMLVTEGIKIPADGRIIHHNDLCVDESTLTGEAEGVWKCEHTADKDGGDEPDKRVEDPWRKDYVYGGTTVLRGSGYVRVDKTGAATEYGKIGKNVAESKTKRSPLQVQTGTLIKICAGVAAVLFALVGLITYFNLPDKTDGETVGIGYKITRSVLAGISLAMATIPEEFPVILTIFLSMGAWRLAKNNALIRKMPAVETLGAVSVLCVDKTGTITKNLMELAETVTVDCGEKHLARIMGMACETSAYDPMEKAILDYCQALGLDNEKLFAGELVAEYSFTDELKMMGHIWRTDGGLTACIKGSPERVLPLCNLNAEETEKYTKQHGVLAEKGLRVIAVGEAVLDPDGAIPADILDCRLKLLGFAGLYDPPRETVAAGIASCVRAGIRVVMITGDNGITASNIARQVGIPDSGSIITGAELSVMTDEELRGKIKKINIFSRVLPEHKMRIVNAFKQSGEVVAMTGDGVNDAAALKHADIGIAMGRRGSEVSREAADMVLTDDNFSTIVNTVRDGRRIYQNIKKAIGYVFTIHVPIALAALLAPLLGILPENLMLLPLQIMLLELIIDPTCSIVLERQPAERDIMERPPRRRNEKLLSWRLLLKSLLIGLTITAASFGCYYVLLEVLGSTAETARTAALAVLIFANIFLVQVNSSEKDSFVTTLRAMRKDKIMWVANAVTLLLLLVAVYTPLNSFLKLTCLSAAEFFSALGLGAISVLWYEPVKLIRRRRG